MSSRWPSLLSYRSRMSLEDGSLSVGIHLRVRKKTCFQVKVCGVGHVRLSHIHPPSPFPKGAQCVFTDVTSTPKSRESFILSPLPQERVRKPAGDTGRCLLGASKIATSLLLKQIQERAGFPGWATWLLLWCWEWFRHRTKTTLRILLGPERWTRKTTRQTKTKASLLLFDYFSFDK